MRWGRLRSLLSAPSDLSGWTVEEYLLERTRPGMPIAPRTGRETVALINRMSGLLPLPAVAVARSITDAARPAGAEVHPTIVDVVDRYLPGSLRAFEAASARPDRGRAEELLCHQLALLRRATSDLLRAQAEHDGLDLQIQSAFLRQRFAGPSPLDLPSPVDEASGTVQVPFDVGLGYDVVSGMPPGGEGPIEMPSTPAQTPLDGHAHVRADDDPVLIAAPARGKLSLRLGLPRGIVATLGVVVETERRVVDFRHAANRRHLALTRATGFGSPQVDVTLRLPVAGLRRCIVYARSGPRAEPTSTVLFVEDRDRAQADLPTVLTHDPRAPVTVVASGYAEHEGLLVRNESVLFPDLRSAALAFGYDRVEWLDGHTPIR